MSVKATITRFAPSPTGMLHIGGARTALFCKLFAQKNGGKFYLRIEDTDKQRSNEEASKAILNGLQWLGLDWDLFNGFENASLDGIVYQSKRKDRHIKVAEDLVKSGLAWKDFTKIITNENGEKEEIKTDPNGTEYAIRLKVPEGTTTVEDEIHSTIIFNNKDIGEDMVLVRSNGDPTYMLCVVVDDIDMGITHIIRGDDHLSNTPKQVLLYKAIGANVPRFAHIPLIYDIEGKKLSKRKNAVSAEEYKKMGYLPSAIINYLMQLGWTTTEANMDTLGMQDASRLFDLKNINKSPSRFDFDKLNNVNLQHIQAIPAEDLYRMLDIIGEDNIFNAAYEDLSKLNNINSIKELLTSLLPSTQITYSGSVLQFLQNNKQVVELLLNAVNTNLPKEIDYDKEKSKQWLDEFLVSTGLKMGVAGKVLRAMLIGQTDGMSVAKIMTILGHDKVIGRLNNVIKII